jgi:hypothetical protein
MQKGRHEERINEKKGEISDQKDQIHNTTSLAMAIYPTEQTAYTSLLAVTFFFQSLIISVHFSIRQKKGCYGNPKITYQYSHAFRLELKPKLIFIPPHTTCLQDPINAVHEQRILFPFNSIKSSNSPSSWRFLTRGRLILHTSGDRWNLRHRATQSPKIRNLNRSTWHYHLSLQFLALDDLEGFFSVKRLVVHERLCEEVKLLALGYKERGRPGAAFLNEAADFLLDELFGAGAELAVIGCQVDVAELVGHAVLCYHGIGHARCLLEILKWVG